jgi:hypothetical protein
MDVAVNVYFQQVRNFNLLNLCTASSLVRRDNSSFSEDIPSVFQVSVQSSEIAATLQ